MKSENQLFFKNDLIFDKTSKVLILDKADGYAENFGKQWQDFNKVQIDSLNSFNISEEYLIKLGKGLFGRFAGDDGSVAYYNLHDLKEGFGLEKDFPYQFNWFKSFQHYIYWIKVFSI